MSNFTFDNENITKEILEQFIEVRDSAECNMMDFNCVRSKANDEGFFELVLIEKEDYLYILRHYSELMEHFEILENVSWYYAGIAACSL